MGPAAAVVVAVISAGAAYSTGIVLFGITLMEAGWAAAAVVGVASLAFSALSGSFGGAKESAPEIPSFTAESRNRTQTIRSSVSPRRVIYGEAQVSGTLVFADSTGSSKEYLHLVIALAGHEVQSIGQVYFIDVPETDSRFDGYFRINRGLGTDSQAADADLVSESSLWSTDHKLTGIAYIYARLKFSRSVWTSGIPAIKTVVRGRKVYDPRDGVTRWTRNPALCIRDYILSQSFGIGATAAEVNEASFIAAANICDEFVAVTADAVTFTADASTDKATLADSTTRFERGTRVRLTTTGTLPAGLALATDYYIITEQDRTKVRFATSYANALAETVVDIIDAGTGVHTVTMTAQPRYTLDGTFDTSKKPIDVAEEMMTCCAGVVVYQEGQYYFYAGAASAAVDSIDASWLRGDMSIRPRVSRRELYNTIQGTFVDPTDKWQPTDFPPVKNTTYQAQDGGREIARDMEFPYTTDVIRAQRLAKIILERSRQGITIDMPCNVKALKLAVWSVVRLTFPAFGWAAKEFRVVSRKLVDNGAVDLILQEEAGATTFAWNSGDATVVDPSPDTSLPLPWVVVAPGTPSIVEQQYVTASGSGTKSKAIMTWAASADAFVQSYEVEYKSSAAVDFTRLAPQSGLTTTFFDLAPDTYSFRVRALNTIGVPSPWSTTVTQEVLGLYARPSDISGLTLTPMMGTAYLRWAQVTDLDVLIGGRIQIRWSPLLTGATWSNSIDLFPPASGNPGGVSGSATEVGVPLASGTYLLKALDNTGNVSANAASISSNVPDLLVMSVVNTATESPTFPGAKSNVIAIDSVLKLDGTSLMDDWGLVDGLTSWDAVGGVAASGTYSFASTVDLGAVYPVRVTTNPAVAAFLANDFFDARTGMVDDWDNWDGAVVGTDANVSIQYRLTNTDPSASPVWGAWTPFLSANVSARGLQFRAVLTTNDPAYNIQVSGLSVVIDLPARDESGTTATSAGADTTITFAQKFWATPYIGHTINGMLTGDYFDLVSKSATGFVFAIRNSAGSRVVRTVDWLAKGFGQGV